MQKRDFPGGTPDPYPAPGLNPQQQMGPMPQPISAKRRRHPVLSHVAVAVVALAIGSSIGSAGHIGDATSTQAGAAATSPAAASPTHDVAASTASSAPASLKTTAPAASAKRTASSVPTRVSGDGEYLVSTDMQSGTYRTAGPADDSLGICYWERDRNASGDFSAIIANDSVSGSSVVTVKRGEYFKTSGCQDWVRVG